MIKTFKLVSLLLAVLTVFSLAACGKSPSGESGVKPADLIGKPFDEELDMAVVAGDKTFRVFADAAEVVEALGSDYEYLETISCTRNGMEKTYKYNGIKVETLPTDDGDTVCLYVITGEGYTTPRGIGIGSTKDEVLAAYPEYYYDGYYYVFTKSNDPNNIGEKRIQIVMENDSVTEINIYAPDYAQ